MYQQPPMYPTTQLYGHQQQLPQFNHGRDYGAAPYSRKDELFHVERTRPNCLAIVIGVLVPWILFTVLFGVVSFSLHYTAAAACSLLEVLALAVVGYFGYMSYAQLKSQADFKWNAFLCITCLIMWIVAVACGSHNFNRNMFPFYDVENMNTYPSIDPTLFKGQQLMDAGQIIFTENSQLSLDYSMGFKNSDVYCVAPISAGNGTASNYDFWAVGLNCCSGHIADFSCGEFNNPLAHAGLRLMRDDLRPYFRLAVQQAEAAYHITANHPVFVYWMQNPQAEINAYQDEGFKYFLSLVFIMFGVQCMLALLAAVAFSKMP